MFIIQQIVYLISGINISPLLVKFIVKSLFVDKDFFCRKYLLFNITTYCILAI